MIQLIFPFAVTDFEQHEQLSNCIARYLRSLCALDRTHQIARSGWGDYGERDRIVRVTGEKIMQLVDNCKYPILKESPLFRDLKQHYAPYRW